MGDPRGDGAATQAVQGAGGRICGEAEARSHEEEGAPGNAVLLLPVAEDALGPIGRAERIRLFGLGSLKYQFFSIKRVLLHKLTK